VLLPGAEEPTNDINTTFAFALVSFCYIQKETIRSHGFIAYIQEYIKLPFNWLPEKKTLWFPIQFIGRCIANICAGALSLPFELLSKIASVLSLSLRLFGNILGGSIITTMLNKAVAGSVLYQTIALATGLNLIVTLFFGLFEAGIQAFVFTLLSVTYLSMGVKK
jgi:F-type H+-transporting ATPase subunit a